MIYHYVTPEAAIAGCRAEVLLCDSGEDLLTGSVEDFNEETLTW